MVHALNHGAHDPSACLAANQWLLGLQWLPLVWAVATSLLASPDPAPPVDLLFFAAQMLRRKIQCPIGGLRLLVAHLLDALLLTMGRFCLSPPWLLKQILVLTTLVLRAEDGVDGLFARIRHLPDAAVELLTAALASRSYQGGVSSLPGPRNR
ncbi:hypothetical protein E2562_032973 [Oryza meyeriana var. granulata]|uniref:DUF4220 domain-containing protein n=1 Tax=Oryza meyeriana var. granulata TaxID=110450 RepID=A0A6G1DAU6_9ORYZ|nr:hypothetical protein E2562_032973 [Oryza meyeriana var. granulata]